VINAQSSIIDGHSWVEIVVDGKRIPIETTEVKYYDESQFYKHYNASGFYNCTELFPKYYKITDSTGKDLTETYRLNCN
jgi:hypothetical protein